MSAGLLDVNVLLALAWPNHQHHAAAHKWFFRGARRGWASCALTQLSFVRLSSNPAYSPAAVSPADAARLLRGLVAHAHHHFWAELPGVVPECFARASGHQQVADAYLVHLAQHHGGRVVTFDAALVAHASDKAAVTVLSGSG